MPLVFWSCPLFGWLRASEYRTRKSPEFGTDESRIKVSSTVGILIVDLSSNQVMKFFSDHQMVCFSNGVLSSRQHCPLFRSWLIKKNGLCWSCFLLQISVPNKKFFPGLVWSCFVLLFSVPNKKIPEQYWISGISGIEIQNLKFRNSCFIFGTETGPEMASPEWRDWNGTGKRMFPNARDGKFPRFFWEMAFGNADL